MSTEDVMVRIRSKGYWRIVIRPTRFERRRLKTLSDVRQAVDACKVALRGWDYPYWEPREAENVGEWVECTVDWSGHIEFWRFYRSGQFIHHVAVHEDHIAVEQQLPTQYPPRPSRSGYLSVVSTTFTLTEIYEFASRLGSKGILGSTIFISIGLHNMLDHQLETFDILRHLRDDYVRGSAEPIVIENVISVQDLVSKTDDLALDAAVEVFEQFNWTNPPRHVMAEDQRRLRERRL